MSQKYNNFENLSLRQKRRRLSSLRNIINNDSEDIESSNSSLDERLQNLPIPESRLGERSGNDERPIPALSASEEDSINSGDEVSYNDSEETVSSNEEDTEEEVDDNFAAENLEREERDEQSEDENHDVNVFQDPVAVKKKILKNVFLSINLKHKHGNLLLKTLREYPFNLAFLPKDTRTLLNTPTDVASNFMQNISGGEYLHIGFGQTIMKKLESLLALPEIIEIDISTDGAKVDKGSDQFWPIQFRISNIPDKRPMIAGIFKGKHKPSNPFDFFEQFIEEIVEIRRQGGMSVRNQQLPLNIRCFIADAPARAFALNHFGHTSSHACSKCKVEGRRCTVPGFEGTMIFVGTRHALRTDEEYENLVDEDHHKGRSPLSEILGLVSRVLFETMHSVYLGNVKKVLAAKIKGKFGHQRLNGRKLDILDSRMSFLTMFCPSEFNRRPREITMSHDFKATEFRQLLLYTSSAVFRNVFEEEYYEHLMILNSVMRLLIPKDTPREMYVWCQTALESYVRSCEVLYGMQFLSYNVHSLLHIVTDVELLGGSDTTSAFGFENNMPELRKCIRKPGLKLAQVYKRLAEKEDSVLVPLDDDIHMHLTLPHAEGPLPEYMNEENCQQFKSLKVGAYTFARTLRDSCCILENFQVFLIKNIVKIENSIFFIVQKFQRLRLVYDIGLSSDLVGIYHCTRLSPEVQEVNFTDVKNKCYRMPVWSSVEGEEERVIEDEWYCTRSLTPLIFPQ